MNELRPRFESRHVEECRRIIRHGSKSFYMASLMLPSQVRLAATALYAFCRVSDDIADQKDSSRRSVDQLYQRLERIYAGNPVSHAADMAFAEVVEHFDIPREIPAAMFEGFEWDVGGKVYHSFDDVIDYSVRVAGTVGLMMSIVMGRRQANTLARACDLGIAMQLINIARDVGEDARNGRIYLPGDWLDQAGVDPKCLVEAPQHSLELGRVVERLLDEADRIYSRGATGITDLPAACRTGIRAAGMVYAEIGEKVRANNCNSIDQRAYTSKGRKLSLMLKSAANGTDAEEADTSPAFRQAQFLIDCSERERDMPFGDGEWILELFAEMERRDRTRGNNAQAVG